MISGKKQTLFIVLLVLIPFFGAWASQAGGQPVHASITRVSGTVEVRSGSGSWRAASPGQQLNAGDHISTGFNSRAVLQLDNGSVIVAEALTRLSLEQLAQRSDTTDTNIFLQIGSVRAEVRSSETQRNNFSIRSANSTASVRGTVLDVAVMGDGRSLQVQAWDGFADVRDLRSGRGTSVGGNASGGNGGAEPAAAPPNPAPPVLTGSTGMITSLASGLAGAGVQKGTRPPGPGRISIGGGRRPSPAGIPGLFDGILDGFLPAAGKAQVDIQLNWPD